MTQSSKNAAVVEDYEKPQSEFCPPVFNPVIVGGKAENINEKKKEQASVHKAEKAATTSILRKPLYYRFIKRLFDVVFSSLVIVIGFIPCAILSLFIAIDTKGSPIYSQERIGQKGPFKFYKFRTMVADSDDVEKHFTPEQLELWEKEHKVTDDPRITVLGSRLRTTSLDELPQFINVLKGDMSIIGPRCITQSELVWFGDDVDLFLSVPQGITGAWQVSERNDATFGSGARQAIELDYCRRATLKFDATIFGSTFSSMFVKKSGK